MPTTYIMGADPVPRLRLGISREGSTLSQFLAQLMVIPLVCASVLAPFFEISPNLPAVRLEQALLPVIFLVYAWFLLAGYVRPIGFNGMFVVGALFCFSTILSIVYGSDILGHSVIGRDFYDIPKLWLPVVFYTVGYEAGLSESSLRRLLDFFGLAILLVCLYAWAQWANLSFTNTLARFYSAGEHVEGGLRYARRVYSTMGNQNVLGQLMTWSVAAFAMATRLRVGKRGRNVAVLVACLITLVMTGSRYGLLTSAFALVLVLFMPSFSKQRSLAATSAGVGFLLLAVLTLYSLSSTNPQLRERIMSLRNPLQTDSMRHRLDNLWQDAAADFVRSPFLGHGPAKTIYTGMVSDSEYLDILKEFGLVGMILYLGYYLLPLYLVAQGLNGAARVGPLQKGLGATYLVLRLSFIMILTSLLMNIGEGTFNNDLLQGFLWIWMGLGSRAAKSLLDASSNQYPCSPLQFPSGDGRLGF